MQCDVCQQKEATVFLTQIVGGKMQKVNLCEACSKEKGVNDPTGFALADLLLGMGAAQEIERSPSGVTCSVCGFTQADFKKTGRLGCSACYDVFAESLESMLKNMQKGSEHVGKSPASLVKNRQMDAQIKNLQSSLERAVAEEEYEKAADLRDQIRRIESGQRV
ncbi:MAG TPA: UvrB/UvrC motif-containing protein [Terrimicrobiaceae bacterium]|jgi:protein arginine kinase activator|nr:UvrB/UvrC motif-containing protein [Terrimicrobiaceae bacterium]